MWQQKDLRWLNINSVEQTRINTERPDFLVSPVSRAFLAALLFIDTPTSVLLAGLGGGAIARYLHHKNPDITGDALEINAAVAEIAKHFFQFPESQTIPLCLFPVDPVQSSHLRFRHLEL